jgi:hypothetical protein
MGQFEIWHIVPRFRPPRKGFHMMFLNWLRTSATPHRIRARATEIAQRCQDDVAARLSPIARHMSLPEARGYIRARAAAVVEEELLAENFAHNLELQVAVRGAVIDEIIRMTLGEIVKIPRPQFVRQAA